MGLSNRKNIKNVLDRSETTEIDEGRIAFFRYKEVCQNIADFYDVDFNTCVAVFVALSPNSSYHLNLRSLVSVLDGYKSGRELESVKVATYNHCRDRAWTYLNGVDFLSVVKGKKIRSFYFNIVNPLDPFNVTIDGHAVNIWKNQKVGLKDVAAARFNYEKVADDYRAVALSSSLLPSQVQAITWMSWRRIHNIFYHGAQPSFFGDNSDLWETLIKPVDIKPF